MSARKQILFVEDELSIAEPFTRALERSGFSVLPAKTVEEALELFEAHSPDLLLLDLSLPDGDGRDICREIRRRSDTPIIMVTARGTEMDRVVGLELGADDYIVKPFSSAEAVARIRAVLRRSTERSLPRSAGDTVLKVGKVQIDPGARKVKLEDREIELSRKEFDLLLRLAQEPEKVVTREELMSTVWDENWFGSTKTLDVHIGWLRKKLDEVPESPSCIETVRGVGYRFTPPKR